MFRRLNQKDGTNLIMMLQLTLGTDHHKSFSQQRGKPKGKRKSRLCSSFREGRTQAFWVS